MAKVIFMRHGQTIYNVDKKVTGRGSNPGLTEDGIIQAHKVGQLLYEQYSMQIDFMVVSNMTRTNQTAEIVNQYLNINKIYYDKELQERDNGEFEGRFLHEVLPLIQALDHHESVPGGESNLVFSTRITNALCSYLHLPQSLGLVVSHGYSGVIVTQTFMGTTIHLSNSEFVVIDPDQIPDFAGICPTISSLPNEGL